MESAIPERPKSALQIPELNFVVTSQIWKCRRLTRAVLSPCMCRAGFTPTVCQACLRYVFSRRWHVAFHWCALLGLTQKIFSARAKTTSVFLTGAPWTPKSGICWPTRLPDSKWQTVRWKLSGGAIPARTARFSYWKSARSWGNETFCFRFQPDLFLLERRGHLLPGNLQEPACARISDHICRTGHLRSSAEARCWRNRLCDGTCLRDAERSGAHARRSMRSRVDHQAQWRRRR